MRIQLQSIKFSPFRGGVENYLYYSSKTLLRLNHNPTILCSHRDLKLPESDFYNGIKILRHPNFHLPIYFSVINPIYYAIKLQKFIEESSKEYDAIWSNYFSYCYASGKAYRNEVPIIYIQPATAPLIFNIASKGYPLAEKIFNRIVNPQRYLIEKKAIEMSDKVVVLSKMRKNEICDFYNISKEKYYVIPPGVDLQKFIPREKDLDLLNELKLPQKSNIILNVSRLSYEKNIKMLIEAFARINIENTFLIIVGDGDQRSNLEYLAKKLNIIENIRFTGFRDDIERFYSIADVFVLPSTYEGFGLVFLEAMASGIPCIGLRSNYPQIIVASEEIIINDKTGFCTDPFSVDDLTDKIEKILSNEELKKKMGKEARSLCEKNYTWENQIKKILEITKK